MANKAIRDRSDMDVRCSERRPSSSPASPTVSARLASKEHELRASRPGKALFRRPERLNRRSTSRRQYAAFLGERVDLAPSFSEEDRRHHLALVLDRTARSRSC